MSETSLNLADFIENLRAELEESMTRGEGSELRFLAETIELELQVAARRAVDGSGKISFKVFGSGAELGGGAERADTVTQKLKLSLTLTDRNGKTGRLINAPKQAGAL